MMMQEEILHSFMHARTTDPCFWLLGPTPFFFSVSPSSPQINFPKLHSEAHRQRCYISLFNFSTRLFMFCVFLLGASYSFFYVLWLRARFFVCMSQISTPPDPFPAPPPTPAVVSNYVSNVMVVKVDPTIGMGGSTTPPAWAGGAKVCVRSFCMTILFKNGILSMYGGASRNL
jgi:hypothetical protein